MRPTAFSVYPAPSTCDTFTPAEIPSTRLKRNRSEPMRMVGICGIHSGCNDRSSAANSSSLALRSNSSSSDVMAGGKAGEFASFEASHGMSYATRKAPS